jgi:DUF1009 family protein
MPSTLGIIAGSRNLPLLIAREARKAGVGRIVAVAFEGETSPEISAFVDQVHWLRVGQLSKMIRAFRDSGVRECVMGGQVAPKNLFDVRPDLRAMAMLVRLKEKNAHTIFGGIARELEKDGVHLVEATPWLREVMPAAGFQLGPRLSGEQRADVEFGFRIAKQISNLEIGQIAVVKNGVVLAVEAFEGTDKCLARGGELGGKAGGAVAVKVAKLHHDMRFDIPCIGAGTVQTCLDARIAVLGIEADKTILLDKEEVVQLLKKKALTIVAA